MRTRVETRRLRRSRPPVGNLEIGLWLLGLALAGALAWAVYAVVATGGVDTCLLGAQHGGAHASLATAAALGGALWCASGVVAWRVRRRLELLALAFLGVYAVGLLVLAETASSVWGPMTCTYG